MPLTQWNAFDPIAQFLGELHASVVSSLDWYFAQIHDLLPEPFFNTQAFLTFFAVVFALYWTMPRRWQMARIWLLVIASFHFYAAWSRDLAFLVTATTLR